MTHHLQKEYNTDFYAWTLHNAALLREGKLSEVDIENIAEEIESMGKSTKRELMNRLTVLIAHLLKWQFQAERRGNSWKYTILEQRRRVKKLMDENPSLNHSLEENLSDAYLDATFMAAAEMDVDASTFRSKCTFSIEEILDAEFFPN